MIGCLPGNGFNGRPHSTANPSPAGLVEAIE